jgi:hypothetical protein
MPETEKPDLPGWDEMSDLDKGAALMHLHKREWEGPEYAESDYPCRYFDHPGLTALSPLEASRHAASLAGPYGVPGLGEDEHERLYNLALDADRARWDAERKAGK